MSRTAAYLQERVDFDDPKTAILFDELAFWMLRFGHLLFQHLDLRHPNDVLDVACGTGFPLLELAQICGPSSRVVGVDIWAAALERARAKLNLHRLPNVEIVEADAAHLPFEGSRFDLLTSNLGLNNFEDPAAVLLECFRVAKSGASFALTTNPQGHMQEFYDVYRQLLREMGKADALERLRTNEEHRGTKESVSALLESAGFRINKIVEDSLTLRYRNGTALFNHLLTRFGFLDGWRTVAGPEDEAEIFAELESRLNTAAAAAGELRLSVPMLFVEARKD